MKIRKSLKRIWREILKLLMIFGIMFFITLLSSYNPSSGDMNKSLFIDTLKMENYPDYVKAEIEKKLEEEVDLYLKNNHPNSKITSQNLVKKCLQYDIDIVFVLAQGKIESGLGVAGMASKTNSVWNVGTFDDGTILFRYEEADHSLEPYLKLLREKYLLRISKSGDTLAIRTWDLIRTKSFTDYSGYRYATSQTYESKLRSVMQNIDMSTKIRFYQDIIRMPSHQMTQIFLKKGLDI